MDSEKALPEEGSMTEGIGRCVDCLKENSRLQLPEPRCRTCLDNVQNWPEAHKEAEAKALRAIARELRLSSKVPLRRMTYAGILAGPRYASHTVEMVGRSVERPRESEPGDYVTIEMPPDSGGGFLEVRRAAVLCGGTKAYIELTWDPAKKWRVAMRGLETKPSTEDRKRLLAGLDLVWPPKRVGRPLGTGYLLRADEVRGAISELRRHHLKVTKTRVAERLNVDIKTLNANVKRLALDWYREASGR